MISAIQNLIRGTDAAVARLYLSLFNERHSLMSFLFHSLFRNQQEIALNRVDPLQRTTIAEFRQFIEYYLEHGYQFVTPQEVINGLAPDKKYALITFDDGYYNNMLAVPVLKEFNVPALFFISTNHVQQNKGFWWDVLYRERAAAGVPHRKIYHEAISMKSLRTDQMEEKLKDLFGPDAFKPRGDIDRPFTPAELKEFASSPHVHLGNHTADHAILTNYSDEQVRAQIQGAQDALKEMTGITPTAIAYPNGAQNPRTVQICEEIGLKLGFTVRPEKQRLPVASTASAMLRLGRFTPHGEAPIVSQCLTYRSDLLFYGLFRDGYLRFHRGQVAQ